MNAIIPVSPGELVDKITILEIKKRNIKAAAKLKIIKTELIHLTKILNEMIDTYKKLEPVVLKEKQKLLTVNKKLWDIENRIRTKEAKQNFDKGFIELARLVYITNDKRSEVKNKINILFGSAIKEVKQYTKYK